MMKEFWKRKKLFCVMTALILAVALLAGCGEKKTADQPAEEANETAEQSDMKEVNGYVILVTDPEGTPVPGAKVQFCSDSMCMMQETDDTGMTVFETDPGVYTVHVLKAPEGYAENSEEYTTQDSYGIVTIILHKEK